MTPKVAECKYDEFGIDQGRSDVGYSVVCLAQCHFNDCCMPQCHSKDRCLAQCHSDSVVACF
jgi:hypothetical protein